MSLVIKPFGAGVPGGVDTQLQYNNMGAFGGMLANYNNVSGAVLFNPSSIATADFTWNWDTGIGISADATTGFIGFGIDSSLNEAAFHFKSASSLFVERTTASTNAIIGLFDVTATTSGDMVAGFGVAMRFRIRDNANVLNQIGRFDFERGSADNEGVFTLRGGTGGVEEFLIIGETGVTIFNPDSLSTADFRWNYDLGTGFSADATDGLVSFFGGISLNDGSQDYKLSARVNSTSQIALVSQSSGVNNVFNMFTADGDGTDNITIQLFAEGTSADSTNSSFLQLGYITSSNEWRIRTSIAGTGTLRPIVFYMGSETITIETTGKMTFNPSSAGKAAINIPAGSTPTTPVDEDIWADATDVYTRKNGVTKTFQLNTVGAVAKTSVQPVETSIGAGTQRYRSVGSASTFEFNFFIPEDAVTITAVYLLCYSSANAVAVDIDLASEYGSTGQLYNTHTEVETTLTYNFTLNIITKLNLLPVLSSLVAGDKGGVSVDHNGIGVTIRYTHLVVEYT